MWSVKNPVYGDHIRVNRGMYSHHGIYVDDNNVVQFASLKEGHEMDPESAEICITTLESFLKGGVLEVREFSEEELKKRRTPSEIVNYAFSKLGTKGYNVVSNNCEHFANECEFGEKNSEQVDKVMSFLGSLFGGTR